MAGLDTLRHPTVAWPRVCTPTPVQRLSADRILDCLGLFCPMPIVKTREALREMVVGQLLEMLSDDPASDADMRSWTRRTGNELLDIAKNGAVYHFLVRKAR
jgi:tRNA 2-thiouridine synthesizing protein A